LAFPACEERNSKGGNEREYCVVKGAELKTLRRGKIKRGKIKRIRNLC
jgi:hypothetical protein